MDGIAVAGSLLVDKLNEIERYPRAGELSEISAVSRAVGGCVPNVAIDLKTLAPGLSVCALGKIGKDGDGAFILRELSARGVEIGGIKSTDDKATSFTEVMSVRGGERTFFTYAGASADFGREDVDFDGLDAKMLHLGYFLLLDRIDRGDGLKILEEAKRRGIKTSIDLVSRSGGRYETILSCLPYTDNLIINEAEAGLLAQTSPENENLRQIAQRLKEYGVRERGIIHRPELSLCLSENGFSALGSYELPQGFIAGATGAGDAFCAGCLLEIYRGKSDSEILGFASAAAVAALNGTDSVSGMKSEAQVRELCKNFERKKICL